MLTDRGWAALGAAAALATLWVLLGEIELLAAGTFLAVATLAAFITTRVGRPRFGIVRRLSPSLVHEGEVIKVDLQVRNTGRRPFRNAALVDDVERLGSARFEIGKIASGTVAQATYQVVCRPRGVYAVGPTRLQVTDPFGLAALDASDTRLDRLIVYPAYEDLEGLPITRGRDPSTQASRPEFSHRGGEDFYTLREYRTGDDLRFVHWPSTARLDQLMIKQLEMPWQSRALIMLDVRQQAYENAACFEKAVQGAASVTRHLSTAGFDADLWAGGTGTTRVADYAATMEALALVEASRDLDFRAAAARLAVTGRGGALVLISGVPDHDLLEVHRLIGRDYGTTVLMTAGETRSTNVAAFHRAGATTVAVRPDESWAVAWSRALDRAWGRTPVG